MNLRQKIKDYMELVVFQHTIFALPFLLTAMVVAAKGWFGWYLLVLGVAAAASARNFAMSFNRLVDKNFDSKNPRTAERPSVDGRLSCSGMSTFVVANGALFCLCAYLINELAFNISFFVLALLASYSYFKRFSSAAHLVLGISLGFAPIAGAVAVTGAIPLWSILLAAGVAFWVAGFDILYSLQDIEFDRANNLFSIPSRYGIAAALNISRLFHMLSIVFWALFVKEVAGGFFMEAAIFLAIFMLGFQHYIVSKSLSNINRAFFTINGWLSVAFFLLTVIDIISR